jgi:hypothetical protein
MFLFFTLTSANGTYTLYENALARAPFWPADYLPCTAYPCARACAMADYPGDLANPAAFASMKACILGECAGASGEGVVEGPALAVGGMRMGRMGRRRRARRRRRFRVRVPRGWGCLG